MPEATAHAVSSATGGPNPPLSPTRRAAAGVAIALLVGGATGVIVRLLMRAVAVVFDHEPSMSIPATAAIVLLFAIGLMPASVLLALGLRRSGAAVLVVTTLAHLSQIVVVGLDEGAAALFENLSPLTAAIISAFVLAPPAAAVGVWRLTSELSRHHERSRGA